MLTRHGDVAEVADNATHMAKVVAVIYPKIGTD